jgi:UDP-N-acetylmuramate--alanine ligase
VFQPHRYSRTNVFAQDFGRSFADADRIVFMDVYSAGEAPIPGVSGKTLLDATLEAAPRSRVAYLPHRGDVVPYLSGRIRKGDIVLTMGAGDVTALGPEILAQLGDRASEGDVSCS